LDAQLEMRDEYDEQIYKLAEAGKLGWSTGAAGHLVERVSIGKSWEIKILADRRSKPNHTAGGIPQCCRPCQIFISDHRGGHYDRRNQSPYH
jgi:hypothetical protein